MGYIGLFLGALIVILPVIGIADWALRKVGIRRLWLAALLAALITTTIAGFGFANGGQPKMQLAASIYVPASFVWFCALSYRQRRAASRSKK